MERWKRTSSGTGRPATHMTYSRAHVNEKRWEEASQREKLLQTRNKRKMVMTCDKEGRERRKEKGRRGPRRDIYMRTLRCWLTKVIKDLFLEYNHSSFGLSTDFH